MAEVQAMHSLKIFGVDSPDCGVAEREAAECWTVFFPSVDKAGEEGVRLDVADVGEVHVEAEDWVLVWVC